MRYDNQMQDWRKAFARRICILQIKIAYAIRMPDNKKACAATYSKHCIKLNQIFSFYIGFVAIQSPFPKDLKIIFCVKSQKFFIIFTFQIHKAAANFFLYLMNFIYCQMEKICSGDQRIVSVGIIFS